MTDSWKIKPPLPKWIAEKCTVCFGNDKTCDHTELRYVLQKLIERCKDSGAKTNETNKT